ncbi:hypothetical protein [Rhodoferax sp.]|uniref:hypothetical protein n=1 Tax=Rhodoferax sp. TaxID=50421 RepID=UPI0025E423CA|nr:hypothetical protein [Rhodoferax sp.]
MIGIDRNNWLVYEGTSMYGHGVWPTPVVLRATIVAVEEDWGKLPTSMHIDDAKLVFREDMFDPVTGLRRGRLYQWHDGQTQPSTWYVHQHPAVFEDVGHRDTAGRFRKELLTYHDANPFAGRVLAANGELVIALGTSDALSLWTVVQVERIASGQELLSIKARSNLGVLPELDFVKVPAASKEAVLAALTKLRVAAYREQASSVVEQCRPTAQVILSHWFDAVAGINARADDLGDLIKKIEKNDVGKDRQILLNTGRTLGLFHNRNKPNVKEKFGELARDIKESDAAFALQAIALLLHEVGWTKA